LIAQALSDTHAQAKKLDLKLTLLRFEVQVFELRFPELGEVLERLAVDAKV
jgi:hypothetical protein